MKYATKFKDSKVLEKIDSNLLAAKNIVYALTIQHYTLCTKNKSCSNERKIL